jgi:hypothetical protein
MSILDSFNLYKMRVLEELATLAYENKLTDGFENYIVSNVLILSMY